MKRMELLVNHFQYQDELGYTAKSRVGQWHTSSSQDRTKLNSITYQVGRTVQLRRLRT
jgi:DNA ligase (NAD+)